MSIDGPGPPEGRSPGGSGDVPPSSNHQRADVAALNVGWRQRVEVAAAVGWTSFVGVSGAALEGYVEDHTVSHPDQAPSGHVVHAPPDDAISHHSTHDGRTHAVAWPELESGGESTEDGEPSGADAVLAALEDAGEPFHEARESTEAWRKSDEDAAASAVDDDATEVRPEPRTNEPE